MILLPLSASANSVNVQLFRSPFNLNYGLVESAIHDCLPWEEKSWEPKIFAAADYHYVKSPLVVINTTTNTRSRTLVNSIHTLDLGLGYFFQPSFSLYLQAPIHRSSVPGAEDKMDMGDSRIAGKLLLSDPRSTLVFALMPEFTLPTGNKNRFLSDDSFGAGLLLVAEKDFGAFRLSGNAGYRYAKNASISGIDYRKRIPLALGAAIPVAKKFLLNAEVSGGLSLPTSQEQNPSEIYFGGSYHPHKYLSAILGGSVGSFDRAASVDYRLQAAVRMYFGAPKERAFRYEAPTPVAERRLPPAPKARMAENQSQIEVLEDIQFEHNKDRLLASAKLVLDEVADVMNAHKDLIKRVIVEGHTSLVGSNEYNDRLSVRRAKAVVKYLVEEKKISRTLLVPKGYGESRPKYLPGKSTAAELELNRRVEFKVEKK